MGVTRKALARDDPFQKRDALVLAGAYAAGAAAAAAAVAIGVALAAYGWKEVGWVFSTPGPVSAMRALGETGLIVAIALPMASAAGLLAAACANDSTIGGLVGMAVRESIEWSSGIPPAVIGLAVFVSGIALRVQDATLAAALALVLLNLPNATVRLARAFTAVPRDAREAAAALGATPVATFFGLIQPSAAWAVAAALFALAAQMVGETSAVAIAISGSEGPEPLSVQIWHFASNKSMAGEEAAAALVLVAVVAILLALARACGRRTPEPAVALS